MARFVVETREWKPVQAVADEVMGLTEAAQRLGLSVQAVADLCLRGRLRWVRDTDEPNSRKQGRVFASDVEKERQRRRERHDDGRLKRKRGRPAG